MGAALVPMCALVGSLKVGITKPSSCRVRDGERHNLPSRGKYSNGSFESWLGDVPRVRVRNLSDRQMEQLGELVIANERLAGRPTTAVRTRIEFLKRRRSVWEGIYNIVTKQDAAATLAAVEEANQKVSSLVLPCWSVFISSELQEGPLLIC